MLTREVRDGVAWLRIDRPERRNAMPAAFWGRLRETISGWSPTTGAGGRPARGRDCFSVRQRHRPISPPPRILDARAASTPEATTALEELAALPVPTVAAVHGHCIGGGLELTLACDIVVADATARFSAPEARVGLVPGVLLAWGRERIGDHWLRYLALSGEPLDAEEARLGGAGELVVPAGGHLDRAAELAGEAGGGRPVGGGGGEVRTRPAGARRARSIRRQAAEAARTSPRAGAAFASAARPASAAAERRRELLGEQLDVAVDQVVAIPATEPQK